MNRSIGVFDSGMGGLSTLIELKKILPNENFIYYGDSGNAPYGTKSREEILKLSMNVAEKLVERNVKAIVIACNTATSAAAKELRKKYKDIPVIGVEPALKVAVDSGTKNILVMATVLTLKEKKFNKLANNYEKDVKIHRLPCPELVKIAENGLLEDEIICRNQIRDYLEKYNKEDIDAIVLGCTHFLFYKKYIKECISQDCIVVDGNLGTANFLKKQLSEKNLLRNRKKIGSVEFINSQIKKDGEIDKLNLSKEIYSMFY